jgi:predicted DCC family thiol-disulfide oxidoreductase YuxK
MQKIEQKPVILFDGTCMLCDTFVNFVIKRDKNKTFQYEPYQGTFGQNYEELFTKDDYGTVGLVLENTVLTKSDAVLTVFKMMGRPWSYMYSLKIFPRFIRDVCYNLIAKYRYILFGRKEHCEI